MNIRYLLYIIPQNVVDALAIQHGCANDVVWRFEPIENYAEGLLFDDEAAAIAQAQATTDYVMGFKQNEIITETSDYWIAVEQSSYPFNWAPIS